MGDPIIVQCQTESEITETMFRLNQPSRVELGQMMLVLLFITLSLLQAPVSECKMVKRSLASHPLAKYNDGTPANYYYTDDILHATKLVINLEGGGACSNKEDCIKRCAADIHKFRCQKHKETGVQVKVLGCALNSPMMR